MTSNDVASLQEQYPHVTSGKFHMLNGKNVLRGNWEELAVYLNSLSPNGKEKDFKSWKITWRDCKSKVSKKVQKLRKGRIATENNPVNIVLSELDKRILGIIGHTYVQGLSDVPDSFPEEYNNAVEGLAAGNEDLLRSIPVPVTVPELPDDSSATNNLDEDDSLDPSVSVSTHESHISSTLQSTNIPSTSQFSLQSDISSAQSNLQDISSSSQSRIHTENSSTSQFINLSSVQLIRTRRKSTRLGVQLNDARQSFEKIADKHAEAMMMLAEAMKLQAEALVQLG